MIVLDASAAVELVLWTRLGRQVAARLDLRSVHAPHLIDIEVVQVLRRLVRNVVLQTQRAQEALDDFLALDLNRYPHDLMVARIWSLRDNLTAYEAAYVALAEALSATLVTTDARIARASGHRARVEVISV